MKVKMLTTQAGPKGVFLRGAIRDLSVDEAKELVERGYAEALEKFPLPKEAPEEKAEERQAETAGGKRK